MTRLRSRIVASALGIVGLCAATAAAIAPPAGATSPVLDRNASARTRIEALLTSMPAQFRQTNSIARTLESGMKLTSPVTPRSAAPAGVSIVEHPAPAGTLPIDIKNGPDGNVWFSYPLGMGTINPLTKKITLYPGPLTEGVPYAVNGGPGPYMYFTSLGVSGVTGNDIGRINVFTHKYDLFKIPTPAAYPADLKTGPDGNQWFTEAVAGKVGVFNPTTKKFQEFITGPGTLPQDVATGEGSCLVFRKCAANGSTGINYPHGPLAGHQVWYTLMGPTSTTGSRLPSPFPQPILPAPPANLPQPGNALFTVDTKTYQTHLYPYPTRAAGTLDVEPGGPNNHEVWFPEDVGNKVGYIDTITKQIHEQALPTPGSLPFTIGPAPAGVTPKDALFALEQRANAVAVITNPGTSAQKINEIPIPTGPLALPIDLAQNSRSKSVFFAELLGNNIAEIVFPQSKGAPVK
jgi:streptogramin lyase